VTATVLLFARVADLLGATSVRVALPTPATAADVLAAVRALPGGAGIPAVTRVAVNHRFVDAEAAVHESDEIALIPPVAGG
jgi:molybdopterin converting factor subunit 1